mmetsp:Transcript_16086/g.36784  ORF Transcript_16086/g.36784 Transcript_16086/m.36784 type:complete len:119 (-) Transcript_16086:19-375(-)
MRQYSSMTSTENKKNIHLCLNLQSYFGIIIISRKNFSRRRKNLDSPLLLTICPACYSDRPIIYKDNINSWLSYSESWGFPYHFRSDHPNAHDHLSSHPSDRLLRLLIAAATAAYRTLT